MLAADSEVETPRRVLQRRSGHLRPGKHKLFSDSGLKRPAAAHGAGGAESRAFPPPGDRSAGVTQMTQLAGHAPSRLALAVPVAVGKARPKIASVHA